MGSSNQQYCLRWNNHRSNLLLVFEHLFHTEAFTDVTLACDGHSVKCHKMVLAACSSYFQSLFLENDCRHPIVILKDILYSEVKAILEYMYKGEVNVAQDQLSGLLKAAETLKVKGLVEDHQRGVAGSPVLPPSPYHPQSPPNSTASRPNPPPPHPPSTQLREAPYENNTSPPSYPKNCNSLPSKTFVQNESMYDGPYNPASALTERTALQFPLWPSNKMSSVSSPKPAYQNNHAYENSHYEPVFLKKKKPHTVSSSAASNSSRNDTPILRNVLGHKSDREPQLQSLNYSLANHSPSNGPVELMSDKSLAESPGDHFLEDSTRSMEGDKVLEDNQSLGLDPNDKEAYLGSHQKPEWKRYKQYTRNDILAAIDAVREGMSALQAARKFGVPSRTLYDKVKKLGITTNRPYRKGSFPMYPNQKLDRDRDEGYNPEQLALEIARNGNGGMGHHHGQEGDNDKMELDNGSNIKNEHEQSIPMDDMIDDPRYHGHGSDEHPENGGGSSETASSPSPPRGREAMVREALDREALERDEEDDELQLPLSGHQILKRDHPGIISGQRLIKEEI